MEALQMLKSQNINSQAHKLTGSKLQCTSSKSTRYNREKLISEQGLEGQGSEQLSGVRSAGRHHRSFVHLPSHPANPA